MRGKPLDTSAEVGPQRILWLRGDRGLDLRGRLVEMPECLEDKAERPVAVVVIGSQLHRFARICKRRFRIVFRQVGEHLQAGAQSVCAPMLRVELTKLVTELPRAAE